MADHTWNEEDADLPSWVVGDRVRAIREVHEILGEQRAQRRRVTHAVPGDEGTITALPHPRRPVVAFDDNPDTQVACADFEVEPTPEVESDPATWVRFPED